MSVTCCVLEGGLWLRTRVAGSERFLLSGLLELLLLLGDRQHGSRLTGSLVLIYFLLGLVDAKCCVRADFSLSLFKAVIRRPASRVARIRILDNGPERCTLLRLSAVRLQLARCRQQLRSETSSWPCVHFS